MNRIKVLRKEKGLTQQKVSMDIHVSQQYISKVENGESSLTEDIILRLSKYFHVSIAYLLGATDERYNEWIKENENPKLKKWIESYDRLDHKNREIVEVLVEQLLEKQKEE